MRVDPEPVQPPETIDRCEKERGSARDECQGSRVGRHAAGGRPGCVSRHSGRAAVQTRRNCTRLSSSRAPRSLIRRRDPGCGVREGAPYRLRVLARFDEATEGRWTMSRAGTSTPPGRFRAGERDWVTAF